MHSTEAIYVISRHMADNIIQYNLKMSLKERIRSFLVYPSTKPDSVEVVRKSLTYNPALVQGPIELKDREFVISFMYWCAHAAFECDCSMWYIDDNLNLKRWLLEDLRHIPYTARIARQNRRLEYCISEVNQLHSRLVQGALVMMAHLGPANKKWSNRKHLIALCIAVAEVTEEISFIFNSKLDIAMEVFAQAVLYGWRDDGFLYALSSQVLSVSNTLYI